MVIKSLNLETVCGITSTLPDNILPEVAFAGKILTYQCIDEPEILCKNFTTAGKNTDNKFL